MALQLEQPYLEMLKTIVNKQVDTAQSRPVIFGSRATGRAHKFSDIDLGFVGPKPLPRNIQTQLWLALDESDIPYVVDIVDLSVAQADFKEVAEQAMENI